MAETSRRVSRPLSPHLQIYRPMLTMMMSIAHRISGASLYLGTTLLAGWLLALAAGPAVYEPVAALLASPLGLILLFLYSWALILHMLGGIRHLIWDTGRALSKPAIEVAARATLFGSILVTVLIWGGVLLMRGAV